MERVAGSGRVRGRAVLGRKCCASGRWSVSRVRSRAKVGRQGGRGQSALVGGSRIVEANHGVGTRCFAAKDVTVLTKAEIPAFIPRDDFMQQLYQWAEISIGQRGRTTFGYAMVVEKLFVDEELRGFTCKVGEETTIEVGMDDEITEKYEFIARGPDGFPVPKGKVEEIKGKYLEVRKADDNKVSENAKQAIRELISQVMKAFDSYYAFGSVFSHDST
ncbi:hypothetical protein HOP50_06g44240 [Chloropicon primus]|uniref:Uncharacterized protein n=1 Tax=Chloropicon primus TaxID=1764295 RepID=A0A5B8MRJ0_9CHLO|nr:hypothetical protein A3770_06p44000 [Chloropicon primus]UPR01103.1 hypothetical protein HOP50_06g44240 [Chloropicon primus]|eukprot:QDZ21882.1 hypothetical protein A3770_06p44000 [Chloropicon primus]